MDLGAWEEGVEAAIETAARVIEVAASAIIVIAVAVALLGYARHWFVPHAPEAKREGVRLRLGKHLVLALEFQLAADLLKVAVSPTLESILVVGAIVLIRTVLNFFLERELAAIERAQGLHAARQAV